MFSNGYYPGKPTPEKTNKKGLVAKSEPKIAAHGAPLSATQASMA
jgi:hypothetical protein